MSILRNYYSPNMIHRLNTFITSDITGWVFFHMILGMICGQLPITLETFFIIHTLYEVFEIYDLSKNNFVDNMNMNDFILDTFVAMVGFYYAKLFPIYALVIVGIFIIFITK